MPGDPERIRGLPGRLAHAGQASVCPEAAEGLLQEGIVTGQLCGGESLCPALQSACSSIQAPGRAGLLAWGPPRTPEQQLVFQGLR